MNKLLSNILFSCFLALFAITGNAQNIVIQTQSTSLALRVNNNKQLQQLYFGNRFSDTSAYSSFNMARTPAFPTAGINYNNETAMQEQHADGNISLQLNYVDHSIEKPNDDVTITHINLKDPVYPFYVTLNFAAYNKENIIEEWTSIHHEEKVPVTLMRYAASFISLNDNNF